MSKAYDGSLPYPCKFRLSITLYRKKINSIYEFKTILLTLLYFTMEEDKDNDNNKISIDQYGRKTWNVDAYAKEAKSKSSKKAISSTPNLSNSTINTDKPLSYLTHRDKLLNELLTAVNQHTIINPLNTASYGKNKKFGFFCLVCDLSFRDNLALIDHINSPLHVQRSQSLVTKHDGEDTEILDGNVRRATVDEVRLTLESLIAKLTQDKNSGNNKTNIKERIARRQEFEKNQQAKRKEKRLKSKQNKIAQKNKTDEGNNDISSMMGFGDFGSTKK